MTLLTYKPEAVAADKVLTTAANIATRRNDAGVMVALASLCFAYGKASTANEVPKADPIVAAFAAKQYAESTGRTMPKKGSMEAIVSANGAMVEAGFFKAYDAAPIADYALSQKPQLSHTDRGAFVRRALAAFPDAAPDEAEMKALLPTKKVLTARGKAEEILATYVSAFGEKGTFLSAIITPEQILYAQDAIAALATLVDAFPADAKSNAAELRAKAAALRAEIAKA